VRVPLGWYAFALLVLPIPAIILAFLFFGRPDAGASVMEAILYGYIVQGVIVFVTNNLWEEVAVMGFLQARLQDHHSPIKTDLQAEREVTPDQLPLGKAIALHLLPGVALVSLMYLLAPVMDAIRAPRFLAFLVAGIIVIGGWELGYLLRQGRKRACVDCRASSCIESRFPNRTTRSSCCSLRGC
jgi:hypothetical protein